MNYDLEAGIILYKAVTVLATDRLKPLYGFMGVHRQILENLEPLKISLYALLTTTISCGCDVLSLQASVFESIERIFGAYVSEQFKFWCSRICIEPIRGHLLGWSYFFNALSLMPDHALIGMLPAMPSSRSTELLQVVSAHFGNQAKFVWQNALRSVESLEPDLLEKARTLVPDSDFPQYIDLNTFCLRCISSEQAYLCLHQIFQRLSGDDWRTFLQMATKEGPIEGLPINGVEDVLLTLFGENKGGRAGA